MKTKIYKGTIRVYNCENDYAKDFVDYDQQAGSFTRDEWMSELTAHPEDGGNGLTNEEAEEICNILESTSNIDFFEKN